MALRGGQDEVALEAAAAGTELYASVQSRRGRPVGASYVTMPLAVFVRLLVFGARERPDPAGVRLVRLKRLGRAAARYLIPAGGEVKLLGLG